MGQIAKALGMGSEIRHNGRTYNVSPWTYKIQGEFERYLEGQAVQAVRRMRPHMNEYEWKEAMTQVQRDITTGVYTFGSEQVAQALQALPHMKHLFYLLLKENHPEVTPELAAEIVDSDTREAMARMAEANADPTSPTPEPDPPTS